MTLMSFFCRMLNGKCQETREPDREFYPKTQPKTASPPPSPNTTPPNPPPGTTGGMG